MTEILGAPQRETGKEELVKSLLAPRPKAHPRRGNPLSSLHRTPPRPSGSHRKPAGTPLTPTPVQQLCTNVQSCGQKRFFSYTGRGAFSFGARPKGPRRAPRGGERRRKGAGAVFAAGGNGAERTLRRRQWGRIPVEAAPCGSRIPAAAGRRPARFPWSPPPVISRRISAGRRWAAPRGNQPLRDAGPRRFGYSALRGASKIFVKNSALDGNFFPLTCVSTGKRSRCSPESIGKDERE